MPERSVLIIDDDQTLVGALKEGLESLGFNVRAAFDGLQGILQAHQDKPDAIMLDFNMPAGGGAGVYERLRHSTDTGKIPIIFLTGATVDEVKQKIRSTPNTFFLKKPVSVGQLRKVLEKIITGTKFPEPGKTPPPAPRGSSAPTPFPTPPSPTQAAAPPAGLMRDAFTPTTSGPASIEKESFAGMSLPGEKKKIPPPPPPPPAPRPASSPVVKAAGGGKTHRHDFRVTYADTDRLGIIYYANYFKFFEVGRTELMRSIGIQYAALEMERKIFLPVVESRCEYLKPSRYDDELSVISWLSWMGPASICFQNEITPIGSPDEPVARGFTRHAVVNELWNAIRIPKDLRELLMPYLQV